MIPYIEILKWNNNTLAAFSLIEPSECWFEISYYSLGEFEISAPATANNLEALKKGYFVKIPNKDYAWVIVSIQYEYNADGARMISAKGYEAKWILSKRIIRDPIELPSVLSSAINKIFTANFGSGAISQRRINGLTWQLNGLQGKSTEAQATRSNLWEFTSNLLKLHKVGAISEIKNGVIVYSTVNGEDKSETVQFSQSLDNIISATYFTSDEDLKTHCQIVSTFNEQEGEGEQQTSVSRDYVAYSPAETAGASGIERSEMTLQSNLSTKVQTEQGETEISPDSAQYIAMQKAEGASKLTEHQTITEFDGEIDLQFSAYLFGIPDAEEAEPERYFFIGDLVKIRDEYFNFEKTARVLKYTFKQDAGGYGEQAEYGDE